VQSLKLPKTYQTIVKMGHSQAKMAPIFKNAPTIKKLSHSLSFNSGEVEERESGEGR